MSPIAPVPGLHPGADSNGLAAGERVESWAGEARVNLIRLAALLAFYGYHLVNVLLLGDATASGAYHLSVTALVMVWAAGVVALHLYLIRHEAHPAVKYAVTAWDLLLLTALLVLAGGPRSPLVVLYFVVIAAAPLRLSLGAVYLAVLGSVASYLFLLGHHAWYVVGAERYYADPQWRLARPQQAIFVLTLGAVGLLAGQAVRQAHRLAQGHAEADRPAGPGQSSADLPPGLAPLPAEVRWHTRGVGFGVPVVGVLVGLGLVLSLTRAPAAPGEGPAWPVVIGIGVAFLAAVVAAVAVALEPVAGASRRVVWQATFPPAGQAPPAPGAAADREDRT